MRQKVKINKWSFCMHFYTSVIDYDKGSKVPSFSPEQYKCCWWPCLDECVARESVELAWVPLCCLHPCNKSTRKTDIISFTQHSWQLTYMYYFFQMIIRLHSLLKRKIGFNCIFKYFFSYLVTPIILPGINLRNSFFVEKNPAWGPPYPMGIPNRWLDPTAMSTPNSPGGRNMVSAKRSVAQVTRVWKKYMMLCCATPHKRTENHCVRSGFTKGY